MTTADTASTLAAGDYGGVLLATQVVNLVVSCIATVVLLRQWRTRRSSATGAALAMFVILVIVVTAGLFQVRDDGSALKHGYTVVLVSVLLLVPYLLVRFAHALGAVGHRSHQGAVGLTVAQIACTLVAPTFPEPGAERTAWFTAYLVLILVGWSVQSVIAAVGLWRAGQDQPSVVRHRMRALSTGAVVIALTLVGSSASGEEGSGLQVVTSLVGVAGVCLLVLAFVVPDWLRSVWRASDLLGLASAERDLMAAMTPHAVGHAIVPAVMQVFGAGGASLVDRDLRPLQTRGSVEGALAALAATAPVDSARDARDGVLRLADGAFACRLDDGWLVVQAGVFAPVFGVAELSLLDRVGSFVDLALQRCRLFEQEAHSRAAAESANTELQTLVYSVSHDLRNPIISVLGYVDVLAQEHGHELSTEGRHYLERISVNGLYMQNLIQDLLELSRIGRSEPPPQAVAVGVLAESVAQEVRVMHPDCDIQIEGAFPVLWMSELRSRQLLTNLIDNAAKHAGGEARVVVRAEPFEHGAVLLVSDNGPGIAEGYRDKAFEVFERLDAARSDVPGTGMGLPICKRIAESLGGRITLEGPQPGVASGTTARVVLPPAVVQAWVTSPHLAKESTR